jgi:hypothetical protein
MQHRHLQLQVIGGMQGENREQRQRVMMPLYNLEAPPCMTGNALSSLSFVLLSLQEFPYQFTHVCCKATSEAANFSD